MVMEGSRGMRVEKVHERNVRQQWERWVRKPNSVVGRCEALWEQIVLSLLLGLGLLKSLLFLVPLGLLNTRNPNPSACIGMLGWIMIQVEVYWVVLQSQPHDRERERER
jgi:hypothetical protein